MDKEMKRRQRRAEREYLDYMQGLGMSPGEAPYALAMSYLMMLAGEALSYLRSLEVLEQSLERAREVSAELTEEQLSRSNLEEVMEATLRVAQRIVDGERLTIDHPDVVHLHTAVRKGQAIMDIEESGGLN